MRLVLIIMVCLASVISSHKCYAQETESLNLLNNAKNYDGKVVIYKGEVIGDIMMRGDHAWLHVNDGAIAIGIWASKDLIRDIDYTGDYKKRGDVVEVAGIFHRSCLEHGGDLDIHAQAIKIITPGSASARTVSKNKIYLGMGSFIIVLLLYALKKLLQGRKQ